jgi:hypothetical protein
MRIRSLGKGKILIDETYVQDLRSFIQFLEDEDTRITYRNYFRVYSGE